MDTVKIEVTFDELDMIMTACEAMEGDGDRFSGESFKKLCSRLRLIDKCHTVMLTAAMHDDNPNPIKWADFEKMDEPTDE